MPPETSLHNFRTPFFARVLAKKCENYASKYGMLYQKYIPVVNEGLLRIMNQCIA
jgi:hypothetical protein